MKREEMVDKLVENDIEDLTQQLLNDDFFLIDAILRGKSGWKQYAFLTDEQIKSEYHDRFEIPT